MSASYRPFRSGSNKSRLWAATALVVFLFIIDVLSGGKLRAEMRVGGAIVSRWGNVAEQAIFGSGFFSSRAALSAESRALSEQLAQYEERAAAYAVLQNENARLHEIVHLAENQPGITAPIISSVRSSPYGTFLIGAGESEGITRGSEVLTSSGFVVGRVSDTGAHTAIVSEILAPGASIEAQVASSAIIVEGKGGGNGATHVPRGVRVSAGDPVTSPALGGRPVGIVGEVASTSASASQDVYIRVPVNLSGLQFVYVISR